MSSAAAAEPSSTSGCRASSATGSSTAPWSTARTPAGGFGITEAIYQRARRRRRRRHHARQSCLGPEGGAGLHRARAAPDPADQLSAGTPGRGAALIEAKSGARVLVINAMGRVFMDPLDDPFAAVERELAACPLPKGADAIIVDMHAETTSEKQSMGHFCDGRASLVVGTHTHAPTADLRILPGGTAFMSDVGMTGDYDSVIGMTKDEPLQRFLRRISVVALRGRRRDRRRCARVAVETDGDRACNAGRRGAARRLPRAGRAGVLGVTSRPRPLFISGCIALYGVVAMSRRAIRLARRDLRLPRCARNDERNERPEKMAGHSQFKNIMHRKGRQDAVKVQAVRQAGARNHRLRQARPARSGDESAAARRHHRGPRGEHAEGQYRARDQEGAPAATRRTTRRSATRATGRAASP